MVGATVRDIARLAEVSPATVSRALARPDAVAEATRRRVVEVAEQLGYRRAVREPLEGVRRPTGTVGLVVPDLNNPTFASLLKAAQHRLAVRGLHAMVVDTDRQAETEIAMARQLSGVVDGMVICSPLADPADLRHLARQTPLLLVDGQADPLPSLTIEYADGMTQVVAHLSALGHRTIAYAGGRVSTHAEAQRRIGLEAAAAEREVTLIDLGHFSAGVGGGYSAADALLTTEATAIVCINTFVAVGLMNRLAQRGVRVPADISVVEFDAATTNQLVSPMLTTVAPSSGAVGTAVADAVIQLIGAEQEAPRHRTIPVELSIQQSTAVPPTTG